MAKLKCDQHDRRVLVLLEQNVTVHREDGSHCKSRTLSFDRQSAPNPYFTGDWGDPSARALLIELFTVGVEGSA